MTIVSVQSRVAYGHVGNAAAAFALQRLGHAVIALDTVCLAYHPGHGPALGRMVPAEEIAAAINGLAAIGALDEVDTVLSGYLGTPAVGRVVLGAVSRIRAKRADLLYVLDPVIGDRDKGIYVAEALPAFYAEEAVAAADLVTPNHFELEVLAGQPLPRLTDVLAATEALRSRGPRTIVVTSVATVEVGADTLTTIGVDPSGAWRVTTPRLPTRAKGAGDLFTAVLVAHVRSGSPLPVALAESVAAVHAVVERTVAAGSQELCLVAAQEALLRPPHHFAARPVEVALTPPF